eukprot:TRINITY_DN4694_c0_g1_i3.p1 TRINITY_DN4694_c0_g1~~TRINITY_DN4694_c0_g1_i3.p1  ORF type:complete len:606 (-),score=130.05 TRINITY_DN4694_c0_g1_i3:134-1882(-)
MDLNNQQCYDGILSSTTVRECALYRQPTEGSYDEIVHGWNLEFPDPECKARSDEWIENFTPPEDDSLRAGLGKEWSLLSDEQVISLSNASYLKGLDTYATVTVLGYFDKGKTFLLNKLSGGNLENGNTITTRGISISVPRDPNCKLLMVDTAGTNSPIDTALLRRTKEQLGDLAVNECPRPSQYHSLEESIAMESMVDERDRVIADLVREKAIVSKKAVEDFIQRCVLEIADIVVVVVNELTWGDQQIIEALNAYEIITKVGGKFERNRLQVIVLHNYRETEDLHTAEALIKKYVVDCYSGEMLNEEVQTANGKCSIKHYQSHNGQCNHYFIAKEGSPAGAAMNEAAYLTIKNHLGVATKTGEVQQNFGIRLLRGAFKHLNEYFFKGPLRNCKMIVNKEAKEVRIVVIADNEREAFKMTRDGIVFDGFHVNLSATSTLTTDLDVIKIEEGILIVLDVPGFSTKLGDEKKEDFLASYQYPEKHNFHVTPDHRNRKLTIIGKRFSYYRSYEDNLNLSGQVRQYSESDLHLKPERKGGEFRREITLPVGYSLDRSTYKVFIYHGVAQIFVPKVAVKKYSLDDYDF